ncbi:sugar phosphate isomerase/epimerase family protein [Fictibacillus phosphorivorans]|uniref:sugar phosphate isomerase/epimerase family protein n=1 Tax=Fictibacillus phosphorivorans TaxID=1221500 RepID=UPI00203C56AA|nr:sugar phosphate isomerase/epimerase family protein [Fictibacillus phosphorivorans]MCM3720219.1 sugar phosphate isomerase/epimerase [Fictibacillus phosphorivorans]MCM3777894.1 sugar phosphate isomerase/epimerase [Fictibacillus phosphorivorans]
MTNLIKVTGFGDEISPDLTEQLNVLEAEGMKHIELRSVWGKNVVELTEQDIKTIKKELDTKGFQVSAIGSPIGKISILDDFSHQLNDLDKVIKLAEIFDTAYIRVFSFFIPKKEDHFTYREEVINRTKAMVKKAEENDVILLHENEKGIYGDSPECCLDLLTAISSPNFRAVFDMANFVQCGVKPYTEAYPLLQPYIEYVHIKDARFLDGKVLLPGQGDGEMEAVLTQLKEDGYQGFLSIEHHLAAEDEFSGYSQKQLFQQASRALNRLLTNIHQNKEVSS